MGFRPNDEGTPTLGFTPIELLRNEFSKLGPFWWMLWNSLLAFIPVVLAIVFLKRSEQPSARQGTLLFSMQLALILLFLPNAPYVATDLVHFLENVRKSDMSLWRLLATEFPLYVAFVLVGLASYSFTVDRMLFAIRRRYGRRFQAVSLIVIPLLSSLGIYLGRVARFNSWDILQDPFIIARSGSTAIGDFRIVKVIFGMAALLFIFHQAYKVFHDGLRFRLAEYRKARLLRDRADNNAVGSMLVASPGEHQG